MALLRKYKIPSLPVFDYVVKPPSRKRELGRTPARAWLVYSAHYAGDSDQWPYTTSAGITEEGVPFYDAKAGETTENGRTVKFVSGYHQPDAKLETPGKYRGRISMMDGKDFKKGIASLISGNGPYMPNR